jgi:hypothetical protein
VSRKQNYFHLSVIVGAVMNKFDKRMGCGESAAHISPLSPVEPVGFFELSQKPCGYLYTLLTAFNTSVTDFLTHDFQRLTPFNAF